MEKLLAANVAEILNFQIIGVQLRDLLDIFVVAALIYAIILLLKKTHSLFLFNGILVLVLIYIVARFFDLYLTSYLFSFFFGFFVIIFIVVFQRELRRFFEWLSLWRRFSYSKRELIPETVSLQVIDAIEQLASLKTGALIVFQGEEPLDKFTGGGIALGGRVSVPLLLSIFDSSSPGHDGAVFIQGDRVRSFGVHLPLAHKGVTNFGTRHRAALGLAERSDAFIIIVSEEKGTISIAEDGAIKVVTDIDELAARLHDFLREHLLEDGVQSKPWTPLINWKEKSVSLAASVLLWYAFVVQLGAGTIARNFDLPIEFRSLPEGYIIQDVNPVEVTVSLSGSNQDFSFLNPERLKFAVNLTDFSEGKQKVTVSNDAVVNLPVSLSIIKISPTSIQFSIKKSPNSGEQ